jgi:hypothetical protein
VTAPPAPAPAPAPTGVVNPVTFDPAPAAAGPAGVLSDALDGGAAVWVAMFGGLLLMGAFYGHVSLRRRRSA